MQFRRELGSCNYKRLLLYCLRTVMGQLRSVTYSCSVIHYYSLPFIFTLIMHWVQNKIITLIENILLRYHFGFNFIITSELGLSCFNEAKHGKLPVIYFFTLPSLPASHY